MRVCIAGKNEAVVRGLEYALAHLGTDRVLAAQTGTMTASLGGSRPYADLRTNGESRLIR